MRTRLLILMLAAALLPAHSFAGGKNVRVICAADGGLVIRERCRKNEKRLSLANAGLLARAQSPEGEPGDAGKTGAPGQPGEQGDSGAPGERGISSLDGLKDGRLVRGLIGGEYRYGPGLYYESITVNFDFFGAPIGPLLDGDIIVAITSAAESYCSEVKNSCLGVHCSGNPATDPPCCGSCCRTGITEYCYSTHEIRSQDRCRGSAQNPDPQPGTLCIYPIQFDSAAYIKALSYWPFGFSLYWQHDGYSNSEVEAVWAYRAEL